MMRSAPQSLYTALLATVDIGLGTYVFQSMSPVFGVLLVTAGLLVLAAALGELLVSSRFPIAGERDQLTAE